MKFKKFIPYLLFLLFLVVYSLCAAPEVEFTDAGELMGAILSLGVAHPTGYPLFIMLGKLWSLIPNPFLMAHWLNLFAAFWSSIAVLTFYKLILTVFKSLKIEESKSSIISACAGALVFGFGSTAWGIATSIEVYSLQAALFSIIINLFLYSNAINKASAQAKLWWAFALALGFSNHMTTVLLAPAFLFLFFKRPEEKFNFSSNRFKEIALLIIPFLVGISLYLYLPIRSAQSPLFNWGEVHRSFDKFFYHVSGKQYRIWMFSSEAAFELNLKKFITILSLKEFWIIGFIPFLAGAYYSAKKNGTIFIFVSLLILGCLFYSLNYSIHDIESYFALAMIACSIFVSIGFYYLFSAKKNLIYLSFLLPLVSLIGNFKENDKSKEILASEYTNIMMSNLEPNALIITSQWDYFCAAFWYKQKYENFRPDAAILDYELLRRTWYPDQFERWYPDVIKNSKTELSDYLKDLDAFESEESYSPESIQYHYVNLINSIIDNNFGKRPIYITPEALQREGEIAAKYVKYPESWAFRLTKDSSAQTINLDKMDVSRFAASAKLYDDDLEHSIKIMAAQNLDNLGAYATETKQYQTAQKAFEMAKSIDPKNSAAIRYLNFLRGLK